MIAPCTAACISVKCQGLTPFFPIFLIVSSQGANKFTIIDLQPPHQPVGEFQISGLGSTDGIDVLNLSLNEVFTQGIFAAHNGNNCCPVQAVKWEDVASEVGGLTIDTDSWNPRLSSHCQNNEEPDAGQPDADADQDAGQTEDQDPSGDDGPGEEDGQSEDAGADQQDAGADEQDAGQDQSDQGSPGDIGADFGSDPDTDPADDTASDCSCHSFGRDRASIFFLFILFGLLARRIRETNQS